RARDYRRRATRFDAAIVAATAFAAVFISIEFCVLIGVTMSFLLAVPRAGRMLLTEFVVTGEGGVHERLPDDDPCEHILILRLEREVRASACPTTIRVSTSCSSDSRGRCSSGRPPPSSSTGRRSRVASRPLP